MSHCQCMVDKTYAFTMYCNMTRTKQNQTVGILCGIYCLSIYSRESFQYGLLWSVWYEFRHYGNVFNALRKCPYFADHSFKCCFVKDKFCICTQVSLKCFPADPINNYKLALVLVMTCCQKDYKPLPPPMLIKLYGTLDHYVFLHHFC